MRTPNRPYLRIPVWSLELEAWSFRGRRPRRGVVLLIVVSLLALFILLGATFTVVALQALHGSKLELSVQRHGDAPETEMDLVLGQILYDSAARTSIQGHGMLADLYGRDGIAGRVAVEPPPAPPAPPTSTNPDLDTLGDTDPKNDKNGQFLVFLAAVEPQNEQPYGQKYLEDGGGWSSVPDYYCGRVLTFKTGPLAGKSTRITHYAPLASGIAKFYVEMPKHNASAIVYPAVGDKFLINGAPFNGTGYGYADASGTYRLNQSAGGTGAVVPINEDYVALLPHFSGYNSYGTAAILLASQGGMDESYDAVDYQNMFLAMVPAARAVNNNLPLIPSFHRPELLQYWISKMDPSAVAPSLIDPTQNVPIFANANVKNFLRHFIFRPMPWDHPNFTGSNPSMPSGTADLERTWFNLKDLKGLWDIDNDGDLVPDSIWIDPGLPIITMPDGRRVKRLAAILVKDLDGRVNVNVHGNTQQYAQLGVNYHHRTAHGITYPGQPGQTPPPTVYLPRGLGMGPAEVDFQHIFLSGIANPTPQQRADAQLAYTNIFTRRYFRNTAGTTESDPGASGADIYANYRWMGLPDDQLAINYSATLVAKQWASPPDVWGRRVFALDLYGQPAWGFATDTTPLERTDNPYEVQYDYTRAQADDPYQPRELERLLRYHDPDSPSIYSRLLDPYVTGGLLGDMTTAGERPGEVGIGQTRRESLSVMGSYIPVPPGVFLTEQRAALTVGPIETGQTVPGPGYNSILDLYYKQLAGDATAFNSIVPFELRHGELFNINRPFGNGVDDNNNYVADEPSERALQEVIVQNGPEMEKRNDPQPTTITDPRAIYARHLYCLMMLLKDSTWKVQVDLDGSGAVDNKDTARAIAQWAVNAVDFRDSDSIMTRFDYDPAPFGDPSATPPTTPGWNPTAFVWGVERPELLISETLAYHDRRTEDLATEAQNPNDAMDSRDTVNNPSNPNNPDTDFDQRLMPRGACFIELYNPWHDQSDGAFQHQPAELYTTVNSIGGVELDRMTGGTTSVPVWRLLIVQGITHGAIKTPPPLSSPTGPQQNSSPFDPDNSLRTNPSDIERAVFFADPTNVADLPLNCPMFYSSASTTAPNPPNPPPGLSVLAPGQYAVVGSSGISTTTMNTTTYTNYVGRLTGDVDSMTNKATTRRIVLNPGRQRTGGIQQSEVQVLNNSPTPATDDNPAQLMLAKAPIAIPIDQPRSFNVTEPPNGYIAVTGSTFTPPVAPDVDGSFQPPIDVPLDPKGTPGPGVWDPHTDGTFGNYRTVLLQRLADPTQAWNTTTNPYITIDRSSIDVTAFNGVTSATNPNITPNANQVVNFQTFQRGGSHTALGNWNATQITVNALDTNRLLWPMTAPRDFDYALPPASTGEAVMVPHYFAYELFHSLGFLNSRYGPRVQTGNYAGAPASQGGANPVTATFPWLTFNNRPFANPMELMLVPATDRYGLLSNFSIKTTTSTNEFETPAPFTHLLNFFQAKDTAGGTTGPHFSRLFDFVCVPSPYVQADLYYNPSHFSTTYTNTYPASAPGATMFRPPFNKLSRFRDPGRTNLNTVFDDPNTVAVASYTGNEILSALFKGTPSMDPDPNIGSYTAGRGALFVQALRMSRQGDPGDPMATNPLFTLNASTPKPTIFHNPIRAQDASDLVPGIPTPVPPPVEGGFLRSQGPAPFTTPTPATTPLLAYNSIGPNYEHEDTDRNPYFRYQQYQRIGNLLSTQSNCYAVWITIGYFEVEENRAAVGGPIIYDLAHPDGYRLGAEVGIDTGDVTRHRGFFLIDRSIPVGYSPGAKMNTDECVLIKRLIE